MVVLNSLSFKTQSCDLVQYKRPKVTHITFCVLEPVEKFVDKFSYIDKDQFTIRPDDYIDSLSQKFYADIFSKERAIDILKETIKNFLQNNHPWAFFISLPIKSKNSYYFANLTKILPLKMEHYESILNLAKYKLSEEFSGKLGWMLANLYGRVGTPEYSPQKLKEISSDIFKIAESKIFQLSSKSKNLNREDFNKAKKRLNKAKSKNSKEEIAKILKEYSSK